MAPTSGTYRAGRSRPISPDEATVAIAPQCSYVKGRRRPSLTARLPRPQGRCASLRDRLTPALDPRGPAGPGQDFEGRMEPCPPLTAAASGANSCGVDAGAPFGRYP